jgi:hypothetical protein
MRVSFQGPLFDHAIPQEVFDGFPVHGAWLHLLPSGVLESFAQTAASTRAKGILVQHSKRAAESA